MWELDKERKTTALKSSAVAGGCSPNQDTVLSPDHQGHSFLRVIQLIMDISATDWGRQCSTHQAKYCKVESLPSES